jgi:hypothetical protein
MKAFRLGVAAWLLLVAGAAAQYVEVVLEFDQTSWKRGQSGQSTERSWTNAARCVFGTNSWLIEGDFMRSARQTWWCTGSNIFTRTIITEKLPDDRPGREFFGPAPHVGEKSEETFGPRSNFRFHGLPQVPWLAFCSGTFVKAKGHQLLPPLSENYLEDQLNDKTQTFNDALGLPNDVKIFKSDSTLLCTYRVLQSTNVSIGTIPTRFELIQFRESDSGKMENRWRVRGSVTSIKETSQPPLPEDPQGN